jgi:hypothetical protein
MEERLSKWLSLNSLIEENGGELQQMLKPELQRYTYTV